MYQALYRKWRPKTFDDVIGQDHITKTLKNQMKTGRLSHAYLFVGTRGTGKTTCAKILAKAANCECPSDGNPCNECKSCVGIDSGAVLDVTELDAASNNGVDNVRALREEAIFSPAQVKKRVYIIDEVHMLSTPAFNALLKILEEPPAHLLFILATTEMSKVPATVLSRCQRHGFKRIERAVIEARLQYIAERESIDLKPEASRILARLAEGSMRDALSLLDRCSGSDAVDAQAVYSAVGLAGSEKTESLFEAVSSGKTERAVSIFSELWRDGKDPSSLLSELNTLMRDVLILQIAPVSGPELISGDFGAQTLEAAKAKSSRTALISRMSTIQSALYAMKSSRNPKTTAELCLISLCAGDADTGTAELSERVEKLEAALVKGSGRDAPPERESPVYVAEDAGEPEASGQGFRTDDRPEPEKYIPGNDEDAGPEDGRTSQAGTDDRPDVWQRILSVIEKKLPAGIFSLLSDSSQIRGTVDGNRLSVIAVPGFALNMLNKPDVLRQLEEAASEITGKEIRVSLSESDKTGPAGAKSLDELKKFGIVTFK